MSEGRALELTEDRVPLDGIELSVSELVEMFGGEVTASRLQQRDFILPLRRGIASGGGVECTVSWAAAEGEGGGTVRLTCNRDVDAPKGQRILLLSAGVVGAVLFMLWPFFPAQKEFGTLAWVGGLLAIAVYLLTLRKTSGGIAADFLQRLATRQRNSPETSP
jgi:hypothetical protein